MRRSTGDIRGYCYTYVLICFGLLSDGNRLCSTKEYIEELFHSSLFDVAHGERAGHYERSPGRGKRNDRPSMMNPVYPLMLRRSTPILFRHPR